MVFCRGKRVIYLYTVLRCCFAAALLVGPLRYNWWRHGPPVYIAPARRSTSSGVSHLTLNQGDFPYLSFAVFCLAFSKLREVFFEVAPGTFTNPKKPRESLRYVQFPLPKRRESYRGQLGCREELVSAAPVYSCRDYRKLSRTKLSTVTRLDLPVVRLGNPSSNINS